LILLDIPAVKPHLSVDTISRDRAMRQVPQGLWARHSEKNRQQPSRPSRARETEQDAAVPPKRGT